MADARFRVGDTVVLNGHRLTVDVVADDPGGELLSLVWPDGRRQVGILADLLPDPEPREEPSPAWQPGDVVRADDGRVYQWSGEPGAPPWRQLGNLVGPNVPTRPLVRLVPEGSEREAERAEIIAAARHFAASQPPAQALALHEFVLVLACGLPLDGGGERGTLPGREGEPEARNDASGPATTAPGWKEGDPAVWAGKPGVVVDEVHGEPGLWFLPFGDHRRFVLRDDLRPVVLVEKPDQKAFAVAYCYGLRMLGWTAIANRDGTAAAAYAHDALFPGGDS